MADGVPANALPFSYAAAFLDEASLAGLGQEGTRASALNSAEHVPDQALEQVSSALKRADVAPQASHKELTQLLVLPLALAAKLDAPYCVSHPVLALAHPDEIGSAAGSIVSGADLNAALSSKVNPSSRCDIVRLSCPCIVTELSVSSISNAINSYLVSIREWDAQMAAAIWAGCSTQRLLDLSEPIIGSYIALTDALFAAVAITTSFPPLEELSHSLVETGIYPMSKLAHFESLGNNQDWHGHRGSFLDQEGNEVNPLPNMSRVYRLNGNYAAHLVMVCPERIEPWRQRLFELLADRVGECLDRFWSTTLPYNESGSMFLTAILEDGVHDEVDFLSRARLFDFPTAGVFEICVISGAEQRGGIAHIVHQIRLSIKECRAAVIGQRIYLLLIASKESYGKIAAAEAKLFDIVERLQAEIGVSSRFDLLENCHMARMEADVALEYGHKNYPKYLALEAREAHINCVFRFNRYFPCYLVDPYSDTAEFMAEFAKSPNIVSRLRASDRENGTNDFGLLKVYLYYDSSIKRTAELLNMHRNTVIYRLNKIRSEYHIDLEDDDTRLFLHYLFGVLD